MLGAILAGGHSRRMGSDKAMLLLGGEPLWKRQRQVLEGAGADPVVIVRRLEQPGPPGIACLRDSSVDIGPIAGLEAALASRRSPFVAVLAVDMPSIDSKWFTWLRSLCGNGTGAIARHDRIYEPLAAIYPAEAYSEVALRIARKEHSLQGLARALEEAGLMKVAPVSGAEAAKTTSWNTP